MSSADDALRNRIEAFIADLDQLIRKSATEAVKAALGGGAAPGTAPSGATGRKAAAPVPRASAAAAPVSRAARGKATATKITVKPRTLGTKGKKRPPAEIQALVDEVAAFLGKHRGATMEEIRDALGVPSTELVVPTKKLIAAGKLRAEGTKQLTRYFMV